MAEVAAERVVVAALRHAADRRRLTFETFGHGWVVRLGDGTRKRHVFGYDFELNSATATKIAGDKAATFALLQRDGVPAVEHRLFLRDDVAPSGVTGNERADMVAWAEERGWEVVCKSNVGTGGRQVYRVASEEELDEAVAKVFAVHHAVALAPYLQVDGEHRVLMLDGVAQLVYEKQPADGEWRHNLGLGGRAVDLEDGPLRAELVALADTAMRALGLRFGAVDLIDGAGENRVLEVNAGVMMEHYGRSSEARRRRVGEIYDRALEAMFA